MSDRPFPGFYAPEYTQVPNNLFDELLSQLTGAELKVLLYIMRRTFGFRRAEAPISLTQMERGLIIRGERKDHGTGLTRKTLYQAVASLEARGCIDALRSQGEDGAADTTVYRLRVIEEKL